MISIAFKPSGDNSVNTSNGHHLNIFFLDALSWLPLRYVDVGVQAGRKWSAGTSLEI